MKVGNAPGLGRTASWLLAVLLLAAPPGCGTGGGDGGGGDDDGGGTGRAEGAVQLLSVEPASGSARGGDTVVLAGRGFTEDAAVRFGDAAADVEFVDGETLRTTTPPLLAGPVDVTVEVPGEEPAVLEKGFEVLPLELRFVDVPEWSFPAFPDLDSRAATVGDFDGDGDLDLAVFPGPGTPMVLRNDGNGNLEVTPALPAWGDHFVSPVLDARDLAAGDFDGDGDLDLALVQGGVSPPRLLVNDGSGHFADAAEGTLPEDAGDFRRVVAADVDGDGTLDLLLAEGRGEAGDGARNRLYLHPGDPGAPFVRADGQRLPDHGEETAAMVPVDVDRDGDVDLVVGNRAAQDGATLRLLIHVGDGFFDAPTGMLPGPATAVSDVVAGDLDGDGDPDLVALCPAAQDRMYLNDGNGFFFDATPMSMPVDLSTGVRAVLGDLDRDGDPDLVTGNDPQQNRLYLNDGRGRFQDWTPLLPIVQDPTRNVVLVDVDGDSDLDLVILNGPGAANRLLLSVKPEVDPWQ